MLYTNINRGLNLLDLFFVFSCDENIKKKNIKIVWRKLEWCDVLYVWNHIALYNYCISLYIFDFCIFPILGHVQMFSWENNSQSNSVQFNSIQFNASCK